MKKELERIVRYERVVYELEERIKKLEAVAEAARAVVFEYWESPESTPSKANIAMKDLVDKVDALKGAE